MQSAKKKKKKKGLAPTQSRRSNICATDEYDWNKYTGFRRENEAVFRCELLCN